MSVTTAYPPPQWDIIQAEEFNTYEVGEVDRELDAQLLAQVSRTGRLTGCFRISLGGSATIVAKIPANHVLAVGGSGSYVLVLERRPEDIRFRRNGITSDWMDVNQG